ncbi:hypothetical protein JVU11DRAFT_4140 [Chiua virens]|nr:hypothetical protein JVU11DRAFT_4140 [Chiua virens]
MAHSNAYPYPLPFPNELQLSQISSYSSLANALGTDPGYSSQQRSETKCNATTKSQAIYLNAPPVNNPSYPYPARNVINPGTYFARAPLSVSNGRCLSDTSISQDQRSDQKHLHASASRYHRLPQPIFMEPGAPYGYRGIEPPVIHFRRKEDKDPYSVWELLTMNTMPDIMDGDSPILVESVERRITVKLVWPGYSRYPFEKRIPIKKGAPLTPTLLLMALARHINEFARWIQVGYPIFRDEFFLINYPLPQNEGAVIEPGQERWEIMGVPGGASAIWKNCLIISLQHRTGSTWQPEVFYPRG